MPSLLATTGAMMLVPTLPLYLAEQTTSLTLISVVLAAAAVGGLVGNLPSGALIQRRGERWGFIAGIALSAAGTLALALTTGIWLPFVACLVAGAGQSARLLARQAYARRAIGLVIRGRLMSLYGGIGRVALLVGPLAGGFLGESIGFRPTFAVSAGLLTAALVAALLAGPGTDGRPSAQRRNASQGVRGVMRSHGRVIGLAGLGQMGASLVRVGRLTLIPLYGDAIGLDLSDVGIVVAIAGGLDLLLFPAAGWLMDHFGRLYAIVPSFVIMAAGLASLPLAQSFGTLAAAALLIGFGNGIGSGTMLTLSTDLAPAENPAEFLGLLRLLADLGRILGPLAVGIVADQADLGASALVLAGVGVATALLFVFAIGEPAPESVSAGRIGSR
ncbi:MAG: MFS transporter [Acidimicrobiia bacterium]|nr:MFS transporter [Acidimicrobiia bacterium]